MRRPVSIGFALALGALMIVGCNWTQDIEKVKKDAEATAPPPPGKPPIIPKKPGALKGPNMPHL